MSWLVGAALAVFLLTLAGGLVPFVLRRTERAQHLLIAFGAGVFLGVVFLHLLPEVAATAAAAGARDELSGLTVWLAVLAGVVLLFVLEHLAFQRGNPGEHGESRGEIRGHERHRGVGYATFLGLSVHALASGLGLSAGAEVEELRVALLLSVVSHKAVEGLSLATALLLAGAERRRALIGLALFAAIAPVAALARPVLSPDLGGTGLGLVTAFAAGTFLFVALCDFLPEVFHHRGDVAAKIGLLGAGIAVGVLLHAFEG